MPITRDEVYWLYQIIFGRPPESEEAYELHSAVHANFAYARQAFMRSREFQDSMYPPTYYRQEAHSAVFAKPGGLALAAIVKNEEQNVELMIRSCLPIVDFVVVLDTGSSDDTKNVAQRTLTGGGIPHLIADAPFVNFSQARNDALALVPSIMQWVLMLDADEHLVPEDYRLFADLMATSEVDAWGLPRYSFTDQEKLAPVESYPDHQRRLIRNRSVNPVRFSGTVHEDVVQPFRIHNAPANTVRFAGSVGGPHIHHMGGVITSQETLRKKLEFYIKLSQA